MQIHKFLMIIMSIFLIIGGIDRILGNRFKLGTSFERGIVTMGQLALSMIGIIVLSPVIANCIEPVVLPFYKWLGADPAVFAGMILACDMGGAQLAAELAQSEQAAQLGGIIIASMLGTTISFTIPVSMNIIYDGDRKYAIKGILCGVITIPIGIFTGGVVAGFSVLMLLKNSISVILISVFIALGLWKAESFMIKGFGLLGKIINALATIGLVAAGVQRMTGFVMIPGIGAIEDAFLIVGEIAIILAGAFPLIAMITNLLSRLITIIGKKMGINNRSVSGLIATLANSFATFDMVKEMDPKGKLINMAFAVSGAFAFGDHLAFTAGFDSEMILALLVGKLSAGVAAIGVALIMGDFNKKGIRKPWFYWLKDSESLLI